MELEVSQEQGYVLAATSGRFDGSARDRFKELLHPLVAQSGTNVVLDLSRPGFIDSDGIAELVSVVTHANASGSRVVVAACSPFISEVLKHCKLDRFLEMADSVPDAIRLVLS